jgi:RNA polymerase sigma factor (sigma-70 family)
MTHQIELKNLPNESSERHVRSLIDKEIPRVERKLKVDEAFLRIMVEETPAHKLYRVSLTLDVPEKTLVAKREGHDVEAAIREAFDDIELQVETWKSTTIRGEHLWKRLSKRNELREKKIAVPLEDETQRDAFFTLIHPYLDRLTEFARHAVSYAEARGDLPRDALKPEELVDETLLRAYNQFIKHPDVGSVGNWLVDMAGKQVEEEIKRFRRDAESAVHLEQHLPLTPPAQDVGSPGDAYLDFWEPDEILKVEDVIPDLRVPTPEDKVAAKEVQECVRRTLKEMPSLWRRLLLLRYLDGLNTALIAKRVDMPEPDVDRIIEYGRQYLRQKLIEAGCFTEAGKKDEAVSKEHAR